MLQNIPEAIKPDARCRLFRRATQSIPKNRPELYESEAYVSIWLGFAVEQAKLYIDTHLQYAEAATAEAEANAPQNVIAQVWLSFTVSLCMCARAHACLRLSVCLFLSWFSLPLTPRLCLCVRLGVHVCIRANA